VPESDAVLLIHETTVRGSVFQSPEPRLHMAEVALEPAIESVPLKDRLL